MAIKRHCVKYIILIVFLSGTASVYAFDDGLDAYKKAEGKYVVIRYAPETDPAGLARRLNMQPSDKILAGESIDNEMPYESALAAALDSLYVQVSDILDMHMYSVKPDIKICRTDNQLKDIYNHMFDEDLRDKKSFYVYDLNTIYISEENLRREIIGHEMAHAIICRYFVTPAPIKVQEVLSMYVEYNLRNTERQ